MNQAVESSWMVEKMLESLLISLPFPCPYYQQEIIIGSNLHVLFNC